MNKKSFTNFLYILLFVGIIQLSSCQNFKQPDSTTTSKTEILSPDLMEQFGQDFYIENYDKEGWGFDMISDLFPDTDYIAKQAMIETIKSNDDLKLQIIYAAYFDAKYDETRVLPLKKQFRAFTTVLYRITDDANLSTEISSLTFNYFHQYDQLTNDQRADTPLKQAYDAMQTRLLMLKKEDNKREDTTNYSPHPDEDSN